jgi:hypothetical protein
MLYMLFARLVDAACRGIFADMIKACLPVTQRFSEVLQVILRIGITGIMLYTRAKWNGCNTTPRNWYDKSTRK